MTVYAAPRDHDADAEWIEQNTPYLLNRAPIDHRSDTQQTAAEEGFRNAGIPETPIDRPSVPESGKGLKGRLTLPFTTLSEAVENVPPEPHYVWHGLLAPGATTLLGGKPKDGKTTMMFGLLAALEEGRPFLGLATSQTRALLLTEERPSTLAEKRERWQVDPLLLMRHSAGTRDWAEIVGEAVEAAKANDAGLLIVDTFAEWTSLGGDSENASGAVIEQFRPLHMAAAEGLAVLAIHHLRKGSSDGWDSFRGSGAFQGTVDVLARLSRKSESFRELHSEGRFAASQQTLTYELDGADSFAVSTPTSERDRVLAELQVAVSATAEQLAETLGVTERGLRGHLGALYSDDRVGRTGKGRKNDPHVFHSDSGKRDDPLGVSGIPESQTRLTEAA